MIFTPVYEKYNELFFKSIFDHSSIKADFDAFKDTSIYERYMLNAAQFSAAKSAAEAKLMQAEVFDDNHAVKSYSKFSKDVEQVTNISQKTWLRTEYDSAVKQTVQGERFNRMRDDKDLYPYWVYRGVMDDREREDHVAMEGKVFRIGDPEGDACFPPNDWNCRCWDEQVDDQYLEDNNVSPVTNSEAKQLLDTDVDPQFRFNPADQGILPKKGSYFDVMPSANNGDHKLFDLPPAAKMPETLEEDVNKRIDFIKQNAGGLVDQGEQDMITGHMEAITQINNELRELKAIINQNSIDQDYESFTKNATRYNARVEEINVLVDKVRELKDNYAERAADLLQNAAGPADFKLTGGRSPLISRGESLFKKIIGNKTAVENQTLPVKIGSGRAHYSITENKIVLDKRDSLSTVAHELGHWLETKDKRYMDAVKQFYAKRTEGYRLRRMADLKPGRGYGKNEMTKEDKFIESYTGKLYLRDKTMPIMGTFDQDKQFATEITSMWFTHALDDLEAFIKKDPEHFEFIYKLLNR